MIQSGGILAWGALSLSEQNSFQPRIPRNQLVFAVHVERRALAPPTSLPRIPTVFRQNPRIFH